jgi:hypothetical protein
MVDAALTIAQMLTGWNVAEATGVPLDRVFKIMNEHTRQPVSSPFFKVVSSGRVVGLANHTVLMARDGQELSLLIALRPF